MKPLLAPLLAVALLIAPGCLSGNDEPSKPPVDKPGANVTRTDTVYFLAVGDTTLTKPNGTQDITIPLFSTTPASDRGNSWIYKFEQNATISGGTLTMYVRVNEPTTSQGTPVTCTWRMNIAHDGTGLFPNNSSPCERAMAGPMSGDIKVAMDFSLSKEKVKSGDEFSITFLSFTSSTQAHPTLSILTGSKDHASSIKFKGANETLPA